MEKFKKSEDTTEEIRTRLYFLLFIENKIINRRYRFNLEESDGFSKWIALYLK